MRWRRPDATRRPRSVAGAGHRVRRAGLVLLLLAPLALPAQVQRAHDYLARMDRNGDGRVGLDEYQDWMSYAFERMDRDRDGVLSAAEQPGGRGEALTREAHRALLAARFHRQDANRDGVLDVRELAAPPR